MMPVIRISDQTWDRLKRWAVPLEDSPDDVLRRLLEIAEAHVESLEQARARAVSVTEPESRKNRRLARGKRTSQVAYEMSICEVLYELGGTATAKEVLRQLPRKMEGILGEVDFQELPSGDTRWHKTASFARLLLVRKGLLRGDSERGVWELTQEGIEWMGKLRQ